MKKLFFHSVIVVLLATQAFVVAAENFPDRSMRWVVPYSAGGTTDVMARHLAMEMGKILKKSVIIANKPGEAGILGAVDIARGTPDGYLFGTADSGTLVFNPALHASLPYKVEQDFSFIGGLGKMPLVLVVAPSFPATNFEAFMDIVRSAPGKISAASSGLGSPLHVALELFNQREQVGLQHIPYKGSAPALKSLLRGNVDAMFVDLPPSIQLIQEGKLRVLAVATPRRLALLPDVPTLDELGVKGFTAYSWQGLVAPKGVPADVVALLNQALNVSLKSDIILQKFSVLGIQPMPMSPPQFEAFIRSEDSRWAGVIHRRSD